MTDLLSRTSLPSMRPCWLRLSILLAAAVACASSASAAETVAKDFDIPAGTAETALRKFSTQSGLEVLFSSDAAAGVRTQAVKGRFAPLDAVNRMLAGTPLRAVRDEKNGIVRIARDSDPNVSRAAPLATGARLNESARADGSGGLGVVAGEVIDARNGSPLAGAEIRLGDRLGATTGADGSFILRGVPAGDYNAVARYLGYQPATVHVSVDGGGRAQANFSLSTDSQVVMLDAFTVSTELDSETRSKNRERNAISLTNIISSDGSSPIFGNKIGRFPYWNEA